MVGWNGASAQPSRHSLAYTLHMHIQKHSRQAKTHEHRITFSPIQRHTQRHINTHTHTHTHRRTPQGPLLTSTCLPLTAFNSGQHTSTHTHIQSTQTHHTELLTDTSSHSPPCHSAGCLTTNAWTHTHTKTHRRTAWLLVRSMVRATETP